jgi:hypothetical protein
VILDETGEFAHLNQEGKVWFLAGNYGGTTVRGLDEPVKVPTGKALFFPMLTYGAWVPTDGENEEELRATAKGSMDSVAELQATVDGVELQDLFDYRAESPAGGFNLYVPEGSLLTDPDVGEGLDPGDHLAVADGYWLLLAPLSRGDHEIQFGGLIPNAWQDEGGTWHDFEVDVTYHLDVVGGRSARYIPEPSTVVLAACGLLGLLVYGVRWRKRRRPASG